MWAASARYQHCIDNVTEIGHFGIRAPSSDLVCTKGTRGAVTRPLRAGRQPVTTRRFLQALTVNPHSLPRRS